MVGDCKCDDGQKVRVVLSFGLVALALFVAVCVVVGERIAPRIEAQFGIKESAEPVPGGVSYDALKNSQLNQIPVNEEAGREIKKGDDECIVCMQQIAQPAKPQPAAQTPLNVVSVPTNKRCSLILFASTDRQSNTVLDWFNKDPGLQGLRKECNFHVYTKDNPLYKERYSSMIPVEQFPAVVFCDSEGGHIYVAGRGFLPATPSMLLTELKKSYETQQRVREQDSAPAHTIESTPPNCPDGQCRPVDREPFINPDRQPLFPLLQPRDVDPVQSLLYWLMNPGEAVLAMCCAGLFAVLILVVLVKVLKS